MIRMPLHIGVRRTGTSTGSLALEPTSRPAIPYAFNQMRHEEIGRIRFESNFEFVIREFALDCNCEVICMKVSGAAVLLSPVSE